MHSVPSSVGKEHYRGNNRRSSESNAAPQKSPEPATRKSFTRFLPDEWLRHHLLVEVLHGPGFYCLAAWTWSALSVAFLQITLVGKLGEGTFCFFPVAILCGVAAIVVDLWECSRLHHSILLQRVARRCLQRMSRLGVESKKIVEFVDWFSSDRELQQQFKAGPCRPIRLVIQTLDRLNSTAERYGCVGKYVFKANQEPILHSIQMLRSVPGALANLLSEPLFAWLEEVPRYDPEGWSLAVDRKVIRMPPG